MQEWVASCWEWLMRATEATEVPLRYATLNNSGSGLVRRLEGPGGVAGHDGIHGGGLAIAVGRTRFLGANVSEVECM
jgi:hypothetical protein